MGCARAFGALIMMRDEPMNAPIPEKIEANSYHLEAIADARKRQVELEGMGPAMTEMAADGVYRKAVADHERMLAEKDVLRSKYEAMLMRVAEWIPPTEEHEGLKRFMKDQIDLCIESDCVVYGRPPALQTGAEWLACELVRVKQDIEYHSKLHQDEVERANGRTEWVKALRESLSLSARIQRK